MDNDEDDIWLCHAERRMMMEDNSISFGINICQGFLLILLNAAIVGVILFQKLIRAQKEYVLIAGLAATDVSTGIAVLISGVYRAIWSFQRTVPKWLSTWNCFWSPWNVTFNWSVPASSYMLLLVSVDRIFAVYWPLKYFTLTNRYSQRLIFGLVTFASLHFIVSATLSKYSNLLEEPDFDGNITNCTRYCFNSKDGEMFIYSIYMLAARILAPLLSVIFYHIMALRVRKQISDIKGISDADMVRKLKRLRQFTITHIISGFFTSAFHTTPLMLSFVILPPILKTTGDTSYPYPIFPQAAFTLASMNPLFNLFIYLLRHSELRVGLKLLLKCQQMELQPILHPPSPKLFKNRRNNLVQ